MHAVLRTLTLTALLALAPALAHAADLWIDVRSTSEHLFDSIDGDTHIPLADIAERIGEVAPDKNTPISLYCAVGGRAGKARSILKDMGYTQVKNAGGIDDARRQRGLPTHSN